VAESGLARKFAIKPGNTVRVLNAPDGYADLLSELPEGARVVGAGEGQTDVVVLFGAMRAELEGAIGDALNVVKAGGVFWAAYPKGGRSDLKREVMWEVFEPYGWQAVSQIAIDDTWSALRFRPSADVKSRA